jgi:hypothetical protein
MIAFERLLGHARCQQDESVEALDVRRSEDVPVIRQELPAHILGALEHVQANVTEGDLSVWPPKVPGKTDPENAVPPGSWRWLVTAMLPSGLPVNHWMFLIAVVPTLRQPADEGCQ